MKRGLFLSVASAALLVGFSAHAGETQSGSCGDIVEKVYNRNTGTYTIQKIADCEWRLDENGYFSTNRGEYQNSVYIELENNFQIPADTKIIGSGALDGADNLTNIIIPSGVTKIEEGAFSRSSIENIEIPEGVTEIEDWAFCMSALKNVKLPESVTSIGIGAFSASRIENFILPDGVTNDIAYEAFETSSTATTVYCSASKADTCRDNLSSWYAGGSGSVSFEIHPDYTYDKTTGKYTFYCETGDEACMASKNKITTLFGNKASNTEPIRYTYDDETDEYIVGGKRYNSLKAYTTALNSRDIKRIYIVQEAIEALGTNNKNTFSIRYR